ncbi:MAG: hypothetical protein LBD94_03190 [Rickettsiales bacterium]|jgi:hypothetical protein|nr:hypothetical protein [Rickettsiales bacterium]
MEKYPVEINTGGEIKSQKTDNLFFRLGRAVNETFHRLQFHFQGIYFVRKKSKKILLRECAENGIMDVNQDMTFEEISLKILKKKYRDIHDPTMGFEQNIFNASNLQDKTK